MKAYGAAMGPEVVLSEVKYVRHIEDNAQRQGR